MRHETCRTLPTAAALATLLTVVLGCVLSPTLAFEIPAQNTSAPKDAPMLVAPGELVLAVVIMRHGDRTPQRHAPAFAAGDRSSLEGDRFPIDYTDWPVDYGQLTKMGMMQTRELGRRLRRQYIISKKDHSRQFLSRTYNHAETHVRSTDVDRTLVSAMNTMLGLYAEEDDQDASTHVVVPVHTVEYRTDALMDGSARAHCPRFYAAGQNMLQTGFCRGAILRNTELLAALPALTSRDTSNMSFEQLVSLIAQLRDLRVFQRAHGIIQPENVTRFDSDLDDIVARMAIAKWDLTGLGVLVGGRLLRAVANRIIAVKDLVTGDPKVLSKSREECNAMGSDSDEDGGCPRKLVLYCGHDTTIFDIRSALGLNAVVEGRHGGVAPYAAHVIFELRRRDIASHRKKRRTKSSIAAAIPGAEASAESTNSPTSLAEYTVTVLHGSHRQPTEPVAGPFCGGRSSCSLEQFLQYVNARVPENVDAACGLRESSSDIKDSSGWTMGTRAALGSSLLGAALAGGAAGYVLRGTSFRREGYLPIRG